MMWFVWIGLAFFAGIALFIVTPWTAAKIAGEKWETKVADAYVWLAQTAAHKSAIVDRDGTLELVSKRWDPDISADKDKEHGDPRHHRDGFSVLSRLENKSFGVAISDRASYVSPLLAELGEKAWNAKENGEIGKKDDNKMNDGLLVDKMSPLVDLSHARHLTTGDADPENGHESYVYTTISQEKFNEKLSFGQSMIIVLGALGSMVAMFYLTTQTGDTSGAESTTSTADNSTTVSLLFMLAGLSGLKINRERLQEAGAAVWVLAWITIWPVTALLLEGIVMAAIVSLIMVSVAMVIPVGIALLGPAIPKSIGLMLASLLWILAQLTVGRGVLVRRETGEYEFTKLLEADDRRDCNFIAELSDGKILPIAGTEGDLYRFAWAPLGIVEEKGPENMGPITQDPPSQLVSDGGEKIVSKNTRQGYHGVLSIPANDQWLVTLPQLWSWCAGTSESETIERGRDKALGDHGGSQQLGLVWFSVIVLASIVIGGLFGWLAAGGLA